MSGEWFLAGARVTGASHIKRNVVCQDSFRYKMSPVIMAVADGHGGKQYCRSHRGSNFACNSAILCGAQYATKVFLTEPYNVVKEIAEGKFVQVLLENWQDAVLDDLAANPYTESELSLLKIDKYCENKYQLLKGYGTTLLLAIVLDDKILSWQIGDGDILFYDSKNGVKRPISGDLRHIANETTSMCLKGADKDFKFNVTHTDPDGSRSQYMPELVMLSTDGYSNSFSSQNDFYKAAEDYYDMCRTNGFEIIKQNIKAWLDETSHSGSGDDITLVLAYSKRR